MIDPVPSGRRALVVLGMHRSGTSAFARCVNLLGAGIGERLIPANWGNERGFWEDEDVVAADGAVLEALGYAWHDERPLPPRWWESEAVREPRARIAQIVRRELSRHELWVVKDPRMCRLVPLWQSVFAEIGCAPHFLLSLRHPAEVAASQARRDGFSAEKSNLLWLRHVLESELHTRGAHRVAVRFDDLLSDWRAALARVGRALGIDWPVGLDAAAAEIERFLSRELKHFTLDERKSVRDPGMSRWVCDAWESMGDAVEREGGCGAVTLDRVRGELETADGVFAPVLGALRGELGEARAAVDSEHAGWAGALSELERRESELHAVRAELHAQRDALNTTRDELRAERGVRAEVEAQARALRATLTATEDRARRTEHERRALLARARHFAELADAYRARKILRLVDRFRPPGDLSAAVTPAFRQLIDDSLLFGGSVRGWALAPSESLSRVAALVYPIAVDRRGLYQVSLAPALDLPLEAGCVVVEVVAREGSVLGRAELPAAALREDEPARFSFAPLREVRGAALSLRVSARELDGPLRVLEWRRVPLRGLGPTRRRPFCSLEFAVGA